MTQQIEPIPAGVVTEADLQTQTVYRRCFRTIVHPADASTVDQMNAIEVSGTLDFWNDPEEDLYTEKDGDAV